MTFDRATRGLAARIFRSAPARLALIKGAWPHAVGSELARRTEVLALEGRTLRVRVPDAGWRKVLHRMQPQILARLQDITGNLGPSRLGFSEGQVAVEAEEAPPVAPPAPAAVNDEVAAAARGIHDDELRASFMSLASRYLSRPRSRA